MPNITIIISVLLIILGVGGFLPHRSPTALIPAYVGIALLVLGLIAQKPTLRKHAMHVAVIVGLLGFLASAGRLISAMAAGTTPSALGVISLGGMAVLTLVFVVLCVRSFIQARRSSSAPPAAPSQTNRPAV